MRALFSTGPFLSFKITYQSENSKQIRRSESDKFVWLKSHLLSGVVWSYLDCWWVCVCRCTSRIGRSQTARGCEGICKAKLRCLRRCCTQRRCRKRSLPVCQCVRCLHVTKLVARCPTQWCHFWTPGPKACSPSTLSLALSPLSPVLIGQEALRLFHLNLIL